MTEQQFEQLKQRLDASAKQSPSSLDDAILSNANMTIEQNKFKQGKGQSSDTRFQKKSWLFGFLQTTFAQSAFVSIVLTAAVFVVLALLIKPDVKDSILVVDSNQVEFELLGQALHEPKPLQADQSETTLSIAEIDMPQTQQGRDLILAQMSLLDVQALLDEMTFAEHQDRQFTQSMLSLAMKDIRVMIDNENLNGARVRYARLKESCASCLLPDSLEALLINASQGST